MAKIWLSEIEMCCQLVTGENITQLQDLFQITRLRSLQESFSPNLSKQTPLRQVYKCHHALVKKMR